MNYYTVKFSEPDADSFETVDYNCKTKEIAKQWFREDFGDELEILEIYPWSDEPWKD